MNENRLARLNMQNADITHYTGSVDALGAYVFPSGWKTNFLVSGGFSANRLPALGAALLDSMGQMPVIVLHNGFPGVETAFADILRVLEHEGISVTYAAVDQHHPELEPFYGMAEGDVLSCLRKMAVKLNYEASALFDTTARAFFKILNLSNIPLCLSGLYYLCSIAHQGELHKLVHSLPISEADARLLWSEVNSSENDGPYKQFQSVVKAFADEASHSGWVGGHGNATVNCLAAEKLGASLLLTLDDGHAELMSIYLAEEIKLLRGPALILLYDITPGVELVDAIVNQSGRLYFGILGDHVASLFRAKPEQFSDVTSRVGSMILFHHNTAEAAEPYSKIIGQYDEIRQEQNVGQNRQFGAILPQGRNDGVVYRQQTVFRVKPQDITSLNPGEAFVYLPVYGNQIIYYTCR